ncbi:D-alanyl-D-alanine carboxypeptidase [Glycomyces sambucus]|uniref:D-alanyl-D-alanine carboxypeptidase n=1 Tax=Glycomyces sambucus TaxID=380244 RepID=A0A1G9H5H4_9ACTN|nr:serine hydrolase domain-containing protein [Glycomyces sambucus]SDL08160.1 D-alanyl-D-alanine carboxypeptidase [Glycomyces sambucus]
MTRTDPALAPQRDSETTTDRRRIGRRWTALAAAVLLAAGAAVAVELATTPDEVSGYGQDDLLRDTEALEALGIVGVQARVATDSGPDLLATSGFAEDGTDRPVDGDGYFRIASTGKALVATVVLQLAEEDALTLDDTVDQWLPGLVAGNGNDGGAITVRQLLQHTSGIHDDLPGFADHEDYLERRYDVYTPEQIVQRAMAHRPDFAPGTGWGYSNTGYVLLDMIVERATGRPWHHEVEERILEPLDMDRTYLPGDDPTLRSPHADSYEVYADGERLDVTKVIVPDPGGYVSTTANVNRFLQALLGGELLSEASLAEMQDTVPVGEDMQAFWPGGAYGLGLVERPLSCGGSYWSHEGGESGYINLNGSTDDGRRAVTVSMNTALGGSPESMMRQERTASDLVDHALCGTPGAGRDRGLGTASR